MIFYDLGITRPCHPVAEQNAKRGLLLSTSLELQFSSPNTFEIYSLPLGQEFFLGQHFRLIFGYFYGFLYTFPVFSVLLQFVIQFGKVLERRQCCFLVPRPAPGSAKQSVDYLYVKRFPMISYQKYKSLFCARFGDSKIQSHKLQ